MTNPRAYTQDCGEGEALEAFRDGYPSLHDEPSLEKLCPAKYPSEVLWVGVRVMVSLSSVALELCPSFMVMRQKWP